MKHREIPLMKPFNMLRSGPHKIRTTGGIDE
jgi:hypothetical protein